MAQTEDTELRDLVIEALEKNGSLAKIRALLRANIFLAFEDDCENIKQNERLDNILKLPEGLLSLSIIHEFLEFCNLKNTLFVYMSESRQGKEYKVKGKRSIVDALRLNHTSKDKEPILITLIKTLLALNKSEGSHERFEHGEHSSCTVDHETSSSSSPSQSDNSSDEKNRIDLRLPLDNSDTDSSSGSARNKNSSEYVPNKNIVVSDTDLNVKSVVASKNPENIPIIEENEMKVCKDIQSNKVNNSSSESTSYVELKPFNLMEEKLLNTSGLPNINLKLNKSISKDSPIDSAHKLSSASSESLKRELNACKDITGQKLSPDQSYKYDHTAEYSFDFSSTPASDKTSLPEQNIDKKTNTDGNSQDKTSPRSINSVSISEVDDLISEKSFTGKKSEYYFSNHNTKSFLKDGNKNFDNVSIKSNDSGDFSQSPVPSLSNLSLDYHSE